MSAKSPARIIQNFLVVWLDSNIDESRSDFENSLVKLRHIIASIQTYCDAKECIQFIRRVKEQKIFMIVSGALGQNIVPQIHRWSQIGSIYIFCNNVEFHKEWSHQFPIVKGVYNNITPICDALKIDRQRCDLNMISITFQGVDPLFMYTQLVKEAILQILDDDAASVKELVEFCRQKRDIPESQIQTIEKEYHRHEPI